MHVQHTSVRRCVPTLLRRWGAPVLICAGALGLPWMHGDPARAADDPQSCHVVRFSDVGWTDLTSTTALASVVLEGLDYAPQIQLLSVPVTYASLRSADIDVFLGNWMPTMENDLAPYRDEGSVDVVGVNLEGAAYTLAVPAYTAAKGLRGFADIHRFRDALGAEIYGIEPGNDGNRIVGDMMDANAFGLGDFELVESSEQEMLSQVARKVRAGEDIVFLGWTPHPMNTDFDLAYLDGGDDYFGPDYGGATVYTNVRHGYMDACPNIGRFLENLVFTLAMEGAVMDAIQGGGAEPADAARNWLRAHPQTLDAWLEGVETLGGAPGLPAVRAHLGS